MFFNVFSLIWVLFSLSKTPAAMHRRPLFWYLQGVVGVIEGDGPTQTPNWPKIGSEMGPNGVQLEPKWAPKGSKMAPDASRTADWCGKWFGNGKEWPQKPSR